MRLKRKIDRLLRKLWPGRKDFALYCPTPRNQRRFTVADEASSLERCERGLPIPPRNYWLEYGNDAASYLASGKVDVANMLKSLGSTEFKVPQGGRVLELGCAGGRMLRHFHDHAESGEAWGMDIDAESISWCKHHLSPPFRFATTTTVPHLPFEERSFDLIYCGSVFTHLDDLADAWLLELRRILAPGGRLFVTIHDHNSFRQIQAMGRSHSMNRILNKYPQLEQELLSARSVFIDQGLRSQVFYDRRHFEELAASMYQVLDVRPNAYGYQTGLVLARPCSATQRRAA